MTVQDKKNDNETIKNENDSNKNENIFLLTESDLTDSQKKLQIWLQKKLKQRISPLFQSLRSGIHLCNLLNIYEPGITTPSSRPGMFIERENVEQFIDGCRKIGVEENYLFNTVDLQEMKNLKQVEIAIYALSMTLNGLDKYEGEFLGPKSKKIEKIEFKKVKESANLTFWETSCSNFDNKNK